MAETIHLTAYLGMDLGPGEDNFVSAGGAGSLTPFTAAGEATTDIPVVTGEAALTLKAARMIAVAGDEFITVVSGSGELAAFAVSGDVDLVEAPPTGVIQGELKRLAGGGLVTFRVPMAPLAATVRAERIAVDQPTGAGDTYPFLLYNNRFDGVIADFYMSFAPRSFDLYSSVSSAKRRRAAANLNIGHGVTPTPFPDNVWRQTVGGGYPLSSDNCDMPAPFRLAWVYDSFQPDGDDPPGMVHEVDLVVLDHDDEVFIDTRLATQYSRQVWNPRFDVVSWSSEEAGWIVRACLHRLPFTSDQPAFEKYIDSTDGWLDSRTYEQRLSHVRSVRVEGGDKFTGRLQFRNGYNTTWAATSAAAVDGDRQQATLVLDAAPGSGDGKFGPNCDDDERLVRTINGVAANDAGEFHLDTGQCGRLTVPVHEELVDGVALLNHTLQLLDDCTQCCTCDDYANTYEGIRRLRNRYAALVERAAAVRDLFSENVDRFNEQKACRLGDSLRAVIQPLCPHEILVVVGFCNSSDECLHNLVIPLSFAYADGAGDSEPGVSPPVPLSATTVYEAELSVSPSCESVFREGNVTDAVQAGWQPKTLYNLGGAYPHYYAVWERVEAGSMATLSFNMRFPDSVATDRVEIVLDAYANVPTPIGGSVGSPAPFPIPGYTPGVGPVEESAKALRKVAAPKKLVSGLLQDCCTGT